jgi:tRNA-specific 2-thiouridylase
VLYDGDICLGGGIIEHAATAQHAASSDARQAALAAR